MQITLIKPQGFCGGVTRAVSLAKEAKEKHPDKTIYILGMLAHNQTLIDDLTKQGFVTLLGNDEEEINKLKQGDILVFTAHGHNEKLDELALKKGLITYDATCFKVKSNLDKIKSEVEAGHQVIYIGQAGHKETIAALSVSDKVSLYDTKLLINYQLITDNKPYVINQTTLNYFELNNFYKDIKRHIKGARIENEICDATRLRQEAMLKIEDDTELIVVVGHSKSSNTTKLFDIAKKHYPDALVMMVNDANSMKIFDLSSIKKAAIASGASTPSYIVDEIYDYLSKV